ncbi:MAG: HAMP domain-containing sensor histidine kinase, partial [Myxococcota bacterium]
VIDEVGDVIYGFDFTVSPDDIVAQIGFPETVGRWRLRVVQKKAGSLADHARRQLIDAVFIGLALTVIVAGLLVLLAGLRRERRANALKSEFISNVSHELKTPLSIISMYGELLSLGRTRSAEQATEYAEIIWKESVRLARLIDNVLDFAKIERGADAYEFAEGDIAEVVTRALELSSRRLHSAGMDADLTIADELPPLSIDANVLTLAVLNLIDNAIKYASSGERIELTVEHGKGRVEVSVRDFGPGIPAEEQARVFERFYRAREVRLKPIRGSGIGLALVKHIVHAHGGEVGVTSEGGQGCVFRLWIPMTARG